MKLFRITTVPRSLEKLIEGQMKFMGKNGFKVTMISSDYDRKNLLEAKEQCEFIPVKMTRSITPIQDIFSLIRLYKIFKKQKPIIVHSHTPKAGLLSMVAGRLAGVPIRLHTVAGLPLMEASGFKRFILNQIEKITYICATKVYPNSKGLYKFIIDSKFLSPLKLKVLGNGSSNGINTDYYDVSKIELDILVDLKKKLGISESTFTFIFVGRVVSDKGINELISAFKLICIEKKHNVKLLILGSLEPKLDPLKKVTELEILNNKNIIHIGWVEDIRPYMAISNALVFPSYREGFPNVVMQAGALELPSIVSNINGCNEIIVDGINGRIIPVKNEDAIKNTMLEFIEKTDLYNCMKSNARKLIVERFNQIYLWNLILNEYKTHINEIK